MISASDPDVGDTLTFQLGNPPTGATLTHNGDGTATFSWIPEFTQAGNFPDVLFTVNDDGVPVKADMEAITITVGDVNRPPQFDALGGQIINEGEELSFNVQATDPDGNEITLTVSSAPIGAVFNDNGNGNGNGNGTFTWTPDFGQAGNFTVMFTATDDGAPMQNDTLDVSITVGEVNQPPVLSMIGDRTVAEGELLEFTLTASDSDGDNLSYRIDNTPTGATFTDNGDGTATFSWTPGFDQAGNYPNVLFTVTDDGVPTEADSQTITITVGDVNRPPVLSAIGDRAVDEGELLEIILTGSDPDGDDLFYTIANQPAGSWFTDNGDGTATFSWTPNIGQAGSYPDVLFSVTDNGLSTHSDSESIIITVHPVDVVLFASCGGFDVFETEPGVYQAPGFTGTLIVGTNRREVIYGTNGPNLILGLAGRDLILGGSGNDVICGGAGHDLIYGSRGNDRLFGGKGRDILFGSFGNDRLFGNKGHDFLAGGYGNDALNGGAGRDRCIGGRGRDTEQACE